VCGSAAGSRGGCRCCEPRRIGGRINPVADTGFALRPVTLQAASQAATGYAQVN